MPAFEPGLNCLVAPLRFFRGRSGQEISEHRGKMAGSPVVCAAAGWQVAAVLASKAAARYEVAHQLGTAQQGRTDVIALSNSADVDFSWRCKFASAQSL